MNRDLLWHKLLRRPYLLHTAFHGNPANPPVVLLHGIAATSEDWNRLIPLLTDRYYCITIDLLGFAKSPKPQWADYTMDTHVRSIGYTISRLGLYTNFTLAGHSLGSLLATRYTRLHPKGVDRLLLLSPPVYPPLSTISGKAALKRTDSLIRLYTFLRTHPRMTPDNLRRLSQISALPRSLATDRLTQLPFIRSLERCIEQQTALEDIQAIQTPTDVFYGTLDLVVVPNNVKGLAKHPNVQLHPFPGNHTIGRAYAKTVAAVLSAGG